MLNQGLLLESKYYDEIVSSHMLLNKMSQIKITEKKKKKKLNK